MSRGCGGGKSSACGCAGRIMRSIGSWGRGSLIAGCGRRGGGMAGRGGGVIEILEKKQGEEKKEKGGWWDRYGVVYDI